MKILCILMINSLICVSMYESKRYVSLYLYLGIIRLMVLLLLILWLNTLSLYHKFLSCIENETLIRKFVFNCMEEQTEQVFLISWFPRFFWRITNSDQNTFHDFVQEIPRETIESFHHVQFLTMLPLIIFWFLSF